MIDIIHVTKRFGRTTAVDDATLTIAPGESVALWGANGAGKTTLIRCALGLLAFRGRIVLGGHDVRRDGKAARLMIGYVPQELGFYDDLRVDEAVGFFARLKGLGRSTTVGALENVGLAGHEGKRIRELSGGMKQRLALAIALLGDPPVLFLDEVTASLDAVGREEFVHLLERLSGAGRTMLFASHRLDEVAVLASRVALLERGRIVRQPTCAEFVEEMSSAGSADATLHLTIAPPARAIAMQSLRDGGFAPQLNGVGILVPVRQDQKAAPFRVLGEARVIVDDFEIIAAAPPTAPPAAHAAATPTVASEITS